MKFCNIQYCTNNREIVYRDNCENIITKNKIYFPRNSPIKITFGTHRTKLLCDYETGKYYESRDIKSEF